MLVYDTMYINIVKLYHNVRVCMYKICYQDVIKYCKQYLVIVMLLDATLGFIERTGYFGVHDLT